MINSSFRYINMLIFSAGLLFFALSTVSFSQDNDEDLPPLPPGYFYGEVGVCIPSTGECAGIGCDNCETLYQSSRNGMPGNSYSSRGSYSRGSSESSRTGNQEGVSSQGPDGSDHQATSNGYESRFSNIFGGGSYEGVNPSHYAKAINYYHGTNFAKTFERDKKFDVVRAARIHEAADREYDRLISDPALDLLVEKAARMTKAAKHFTSQKERRNKLRAELAEGQSYYESRKELLNTASEAISASKNYYLAEELDEGAIAGAFADALLDLATSFTPGISWGRDVYEAITGLDLLNGEELDTFARSMSILGSLTCGLGSKIGTGFKVLGKMMRGESRAEDALKVSSRIFNSAGEIIKSRPKHIFVQIKDVHAWENIGEFLGNKPVTDINPFKGTKDLDRIFSKQNNGIWRSLRFGEHEMKKPAGKGMHYHLEEWTTDGKLLTPDQSINILKTKDK